MTKNTIKVNWKVMAQKIKQQWEDDLDHILDFQDTCENLERKLHKQKQQHKMYEKLLKY